MKLNWRVEKSTQEQREEYRKGQRSKYSNKKSCIYCNQPFDYGYTSLKVCGCCSIYIKCFICNKEFKIDLSKYSGTDQRKINEFMQNNEKLSLFCSKSCRIVSQVENYKIFLEENPNVSKEAYLKSLNEQFCEKCNRITTHRGNSCTVCRGIHAVNKMIQYGKDNPEKEKIHRLNCAKAVNSFWDKNPELRKENAINNIVKWNTSKEGKNYSKIHCTELGKIWGPINLAKLNSKEIKFCVKCSKSTAHNGFGVCLICHPNACKIENKLCDTCNIITPHDFKDECQVCNKEKVWCTHCEKFETITYNGIDFHWIFYKSKTKFWIRDFPQQVLLLENKIIGINKLQNDVISGIYCWVINGHPFYIGQSTDILSRCYDHMFEMFNSPQYWNDIANNLVNNTL